MHPLNEFFIDNIDMYLIIQNTLWKKNYSNFKRIGHQELRERLFGSVRSFFTCCNEFFSQFFRDNISERLSKRPIHLKLLLVRQINACLTHLKTAKCFFFKIKNVFFFMFFFSALKKKNIFFTSLVVRQQTREPVGPNNNTFSKFWQIISQIFELSIDFID